MNRFAFLLICIAVLGLRGSAHAEDEHDHDDHAHEEGAHAHEEGHEEHGEDEHADDAHEDHGEFVKLHADELAEFEIEIATAGPDTIETYVTVPGEVRANADRLAHIVPRYSGIVTEVRVKIGDHVEKGQVLAVVESDESLAPFEVKTLIRGTVIEKHITLGEAVSRQRGTFVIADLSTVWIDLTVYQRDLTRIREGQLTRVFVGHGASSDLGRISYVTPIVDETTRTATARIVLPNEDGRWRPGMFVRGKVLLDQTLAAVAVPRTALQTYEGRTVVFVESNEGFAPRPVRVGKAGETSVELLEGLAVGERYVSRGGFTIKAELGRESLSHAGHAH